MGYTFDLAEASLELLLRRADGWAQPYFDDRELPRPRRGAHRATSPLAEATVKVVTERHAPHRERRGPGPGRRARQRAAQGAVERLPGSSTTWSSRTSACACSTAASARARSVRVLIDLSNGEREWTTVGVSENIIEASWEALVDGYTYGLLHPRDRAEE